MKYILFVVLNYLIVISANGQNYFEYNSLIQAKSISNSPLEIVLPGIVYSIDGIKFPNIYNGSLLLPTYHTWNNKNDTLIFDKILYAYRDSNNILLFGNLYGSKRSVVIACTTDSCYDEDANAITDFKIFEKDSLTLFMSIASYNAFGYQQKELFVFAFNRYKSTFVRSFYQLIQSEEEKGATKSYRPVRTGYTFNNKYRQLKLFSLDDRRVNDVYTFNTKTMKFE